MSMYFIRLLFHNTIEKPFYTVQYTAVIYCEFKLINLLFIISMKSFNSRQLLLSAQIGGDKWLRFLKARNLGSVNVRVTCGRATRG